MWLVGGKPWLFLFVVGDDVAGGDVGAVVLSGPESVAIADVLGVGAVVGADAVDSGVVGEVGILSSDTGAGVLQPDVVVEDQLVGLGAL